MLASITDISEMKDFMNDSGDNVTRHAVVTGAGRGIGAAIAKGLAGEGARVTCLDIREDGARSTAEAIVAAGGEATSFHCDVTVFEEVQASLANAIETHGPVTELVANAGGADGERTPFLDLTAELWRRMIDRNLTGAFHCGLVYGRHMADRGSGAIVFVSSISADRFVVKEVVHYGAAKGGVRQLMRGMALELGGYGVRVNAVAPGWVVTPGNEAIVAQQEFHDELVSRIPLGRIGQPEDICGAVNYLLGDTAAFTTGSTIVVDGGLVVQQRPDTSVRRER